MEITQEQRDELVDVLLEAQGCIYCLGQRIVNVLCADYCPKLPPQAVQDLTQILVEIEQRLQPDFACQCRMLEAA